MTYKEAILHLTPGSRVIWITSDHYAEQGTIVQVDEIAGEIVVVVRHGDGLGKELRTDVPINRVGLEYHA